MTMKENPFQALRRKRIQDVKEIIRRDQPITDRKLIATISLEIGLIEKTARGMLDVLHTLEFIEWDGKDKTWSIKTKK